MLLEIANHLGGGDVGWFIDCKDTLDHFKLAFCHAESVVDCRKEHRMAVTDLGMHELLHAGS